MSNVTITSDGTAVGTRVKVDGKPLLGITKIEFEPLEPRGELRAIITLDSVLLDFNLKKGNVLVIEEQ